LTKLGSQNESTDKKSKAQSKRTQSKMKVVEFKFGEDHAVVNLPKPQPAADELLVQVKYSALDTAHDAILKKEMSGYFIHSLSKEPLYLGYHYSGVVEAVGVM
jgi:NADPH:quinone reductase-like Zn-dependent oxidoreductase